MIVIGKTTRDVPRERAVEHIFGYTIINDATARTLQNRHKQWFLGKSIDGYCPMGPCIVTADEVPDPHNMPMRTWLNGQLMQMEGYSRALSIALAMLFSATVFAAIHPQGRAGGGRDRPAPGRGAVRRRGLDLRRCRRPRSRRPARHRL